MEVIKFLEDILEDLKKNKNNIIQIKNLQEILPEDFKSMTYKNELTSKEKLEKIIGSLSKEVKELRNEVKKLKEDRYFSMKDDTIKLIDECNSNYDHIKYDLEQFVSDYAWSNFISKLERNYEEELENLKSKLLKLLTKD